LPARSLLQRVPFPHSGSGDATGFAQATDRLHLAADSDDNVRLLWTLYLVLPTTGMAEFDDLLDRLVAFSGRIVGSAGRSSFQGVGAPSADPASSPVLLHRAMRPRCCGGLVGRHGAAPSPQRFLRAGDRHDQPGHVLWAPASPRRVDEPRLNRVERQITRSHTGSVRASGTEAVNV